MTVRASARGEAEGDAATGPGYPLMTSNDGLMVVVCVAPLPSRYTTIIGRPWLAAVAAWRSFETSAELSWRIGLPSTLTMVSPSCIPASSAASPASRCEPVGVAK